MMSDKLIPLNITIGDRNYRIRLLPEDEAHVRKTLKIINEKIIEFRSQFAGKDMQDYIAMVLIWYATQLASGDSGIANEEMIAALQKLEKQLDEAL